VSFVHKTPQRVLNLLPMDAPFVPLGGSGPALGGGDRWAYDGEMLEEQTEGLLYNGGGYFHEQLPLPLPLPKRPRAEAAAVAFTICAAAQGTDAGIGAGAGVRSTTPAASADATRAWAAGVMPFSHALQLLGNASIICSGPRPDFLMPGEGDSLPSLVGTIFKESPALRRRAGSDNWTSKGGAKGSKETQEPIGQWKVRREYGRIKLRRGQAAAGPTRHELRYHRYTAESTVSGGGTMSARLFHIVGLDGGPRAGQAHQVPRPPPALQTGTLRLRATDDQEAWVEFQAPNGAVVGQISAPASGGSGPRLISGNGDFAE
jgi:hypothetical protein